MIIISCVGGVRDKLEWNVW